WSVTVVMVRDRDGKEVTDAQPRRHSTAPTRAEFEATMRLRGEWPGTATPQSAPVAPERPRPVEPRGEDARTAEAPAATEPETLAEPETTPPAERITERVPEPL